MKAHTSGFKEQIKHYGRELDSLITYELNGETIELSGEKLNSITPIYKGNILKSVMKELDIDSNEDIPLNTEINFKFGVKVNGEYEYVDYGNYIVYKSEKQEDTLSYKITCYDKLLYSMKDYESLGINYPITVRNYINSLCNKIGLIFANASDTFANYDKEIQNELYLDSDNNSLGYTYRDVLDELAQVTASTICINENDELEIRYITDTNDTIDEEYFKNINVNFGQKYGKINSIVLSRAAGSDNVYLRDEQSVAENGLCEIKISDNQIMNFNDRSEYLPDILDKLDGLEYYLNDFSSVGICYYDLCDRYNVQIGENTYTCVMFNDEVNITQGLEEIIYTELIEESETDYTKADKTDRKINQTYLMVDKQNGIIQSLVDNTTYVSDTKSGVGSITLENAYEGQLYKLSIKGQIYLLFPQSDLYPSSDLFTIDSILKVDNDEYKLDIDYLNYINNEICDEFIYENGNCKIIRRVGVDNQGNKYALTDETTEERNSVYINVKEDSTILLKGFDNAILSATYLLQNTFTDNFATEVYVNSSITQTASQITQQVNAKVGSDEIIAKLNLAIEDGQGIVNLTGNQVTIDSDNFKLSADGNLTANSGTFAGTVNTNQDLTVGNNAYIGQNQTSTSDVQKYLYFANDAYIRRWLFPNIGSYMLIQSGYQLNLRCGTTYMYMFNDNAITMSVQPSYGSDIRLKQNIKDVDVNWIDKLNVKEYEYKSNPEKKQIGLIAQDYLKEDWAKYFLNTYLNEDEEEYYSINYGNITNALIKYCQELKEEVNLLKQEIKEIKNEKNNNN